MSFRACHFPSFSSFLTLSSPAGHSLARLHSSQDPSVRINQFSIPGEIIQILLHIKPAAAAELLPSLPSSLPSSALTQERSQLFFPPLRVSASRLLIKTHNHILSLSPQISSLLPDAPFSPCLCLKSSKDSQKRWCFSGHSPRLPVMALTHLSSNLWLPPKTLFLSV